MDSIIIQYILLGFIFIFACYSLFRIIRKTFSPKKFSSKRSACDKDCGCS